MAARASKKRPSEPAEQTAPVTDVVATPAAPPIRAPRLSRLKVWNYRAIGPEGVDVPLDDLVVLVGPNNAGKSTILDAYQLALNAEHSKGVLSTEDFFERRLPRIDRATGAVIDEDRVICPRIEVHTILEECPAPTHFMPIGGGRSQLRERFTWFAPGIVPVRETWIPNSDVADEHADESQGEWRTGINPYGSANVRQGKRAQFYRISGFASPKEQDDTLRKLLKALLVERVHAHFADETVRDESLRPLGETIAAAQKSIAASAADQLRALSDALSADISRVFPEHVVRLEPDTSQEPIPPEDFFLPVPTVRFGPAAGFASVIEQIGTGARRTLLWAVLRALEQIAGSTNKATKKAASKKPATDDGAEVRGGQVLLLDEPEISLHPSAIRAARDTLYDLAEAKVGWQVMVTTHSPQFIDLSRDHTTIIRVERAGGASRATTLYRAASAQFGPDERENLKLLNAFDAHVAELFFGGRTVLVEGDTEHTAFRYVIETANRPDLADVHVVRARGKWNLRLLIRILHQFGKPYAVLHDIDAPGSGGAWQANFAIKELTRSRPDVVHVAALRTFDAALYGGSPANEKPYKAWLQLQSNPTAVARATQLLDALLDRSKQLPPRFVEFTDEQDLTAKLAAEGL